MSLQANKNKEQTQKLLIASGTLPRWWSGNTFQDIFFKQIGFQFNTFNTNMFEQFFLLFKYFRLSFLVFEFLFIFVQLIIYVGFYIVRYDTRSFQQRQLNSHMWSETEYKINIFSELVFLLTNFINFHIPEAWNYVHYTVTYVQAIYITIALGSLISSEIAKRKSFVENKRRTQRIFQLTGSSFSIGSDDDWLLLSITNAFHVINSSIMFINCRSMRRSQHKTVVVGELSQLCWRLQLQLLSFAKSCCCYRRRRWSSSILMITQKP